MVEHGMSLDEMVREYVKAFQSESRGFALKVHHLRVNPEDRLTIADFERMRAVQKANKDLAFAHIAHLVGDHEAVALVSEAVAAARGVNTPSV
jgi:hypothetical protein